MLGPGAEVGAELAESDQVDLISFTDGIATGKTIMRATAGNVKKLTLGGKNPNVFDDADLELAVDYALNGVSSHAGQICSAGRGSWSKALSTTVSWPPCGAHGPYRPGQQLCRGGPDGAPLISAEHLAKVERYVAVALAGPRPNDPARANGLLLPAEPVRRL